MKDRILYYLNKFAKGETTDLTAELLAELKLDSSTFQQYAHEAQAAILHKYDRFAISTIDAFFQKVIRSFTREAGLVGDYRLEVEQDAVLEEVIDNLIDELGSNKELTNWVVEFAKENLENERAWDVRTSLLQFATEIFREAFKDIEDDVIKATGTRKYFTDLRRMLCDERDSFLNDAERLAKEGLNIIEAQRWDVSDIYYGKTSGVHGFLQTYANAKNLKGIETPGPRVRDHFQISANWPSKTNRNPRQMIEVAETKIIPILEALVSLYDTRYQHSLTAEIILQNLYVFGLVADISRKLAEYKEENNLMLLADAPKFLNGVIQDSDTPFIYEKVGSFYRNYLIDEFQDTSAMQWKNFLPLLTNSLDQGYSSMVVGDVKQAVYRWRGGDLKLLQEDIENHIGSARIHVEELSTNFRSAHNIVSFNNTIFEKASALVALETNVSISAEAYRDVAQKNSRRTEGFVQVKFLRDNKWRDQAMARIPKLLEQLQEKGASPHEIAILVRKNDEGQQIVANLLQYKSSDQAKAGCLYDVVSNESLRLDGASSVNLLLSAMRYLLNPEDAIARAHLAYEFAKQQSPERSLIEVFAVTNQVFFESNLPSVFTSEKAALKKLPLVELTETLISIFKLGDLQGEIVYLLAFQNLVLDFYSRERNDLGAFLAWWEENKHKKSVQLSGEVNAVQVLTIHKSKGLQFKYVIVPFCGWGMDHDPWQAPTLWAKTDEQPFAAAGYLPIKYSGSLTKTSFVDCYQEERSRSYLDNLNLLYVALTRAENGMIIMAPHPDVRKNKNTVATFLHTSIQQGFPDQECWSDLLQEYNVGEWNSSGSKQSKSSPESIVLFSYPAHRWRDRLVIRQAGRSFFDESRREQQDKIGYGIYIHALLSRITYASDIPDTLERIVLEGLIRRDERNGLMEQLQELLNNPQIASWFDSSWDVRTEMPVLLATGAENRIDRLLLSGKRAVVIDFKTGGPTKADQKQVQDYVDILRKMNFIDVEGYLLYIRTGEVVSVIHGKIKTSRKLKDDNQLGLF